MRADWSLENPHSLVWHRSGFLLVHYFTHSATLKTGLHLQNWMASPSPRIGQTGRY
ncbi:hypothetical protein MHYP_G00329660 [Metynnis hypsauchen]